MIEQYLPQTNESATVAKSKIFSHLNKALHIVQPLEHLDPIQAYTYMVEKRRALSCEYGQQAELSSSIYFFDQSCAF